MSGEISLSRLYLMRSMYLLTFLALTYDVWPQLIRPGTPLAPLEGVALSFWAAYSGLMALGVRHPLRMLPLMILQMIYKTVWLLAVALPLSSAGLLDTGAKQMAISFVVAIVIDLVAIPWPYVFTHYMKGSGDPWR